MPHLTHFSVMMWGYLSDRWASVTHLLRSKSCTSQCLFRRYFPHLIIISMECLTLCHLVTPGQYISPTDEASYPLRGLDIILTGDIATLIFNRYMVCIIMARFPRWWDYYCSATRVTISESRIVSVALGSNISGAPHCNSKSLIW